MVRLIRLGLRELLLELSLLTACQSNSFALRIGMRYIIGGVIIPIVIVRIYSATSPKTLASILGAIWCLSIG